jgi:hypothetical protein
MTQNVKIVIEQEYIDIEVVNNEQDDVKSVKIPRFHKALVGRLSSDGILRVQPAIIDLAQKKITQ